MVLRAISERSGLLGRLVVGLVGLAWNLATFLVVPVLVVEDVGPIEAIRQSAAYLKRTWGEQIVGNLGMGLVFGLISLGTLAAGVALLVAAAATESAFLIIFVAVCLFAGLRGDRAGEFSAERHLCRGRLPLCRGRGDRDASSPRRW